MTSITKSVFSAGHLYYGRLWVWLGIIMVAAVILLSLIDRSQSINAVLTQDKLMHTLAYGAMMGWFSQIYHRRRSRLLLAILFIALGIVIECLQGFLPTRQFEVRDMLANTYGVVLAWILCATPLGYILQKFEQLFLPHPKYTS